jgi:sec-independent protein translocase protein TatC
MLFAPKNQQYPDDIFAESRMSFGDHIEELRKHLIRAIVGLLVVLIGGFVLDGVGDAMGWPNFGVGKPMMKVIVGPVEDQARAFYAKRNQETLPKLTEIARHRTDPERARELYAKLHDKGWTALSTTEREELRAAPVPMPVYIPVEPLIPVFGTPKDPTIKEVKVEMLVYPAFINYQNNVGETSLENRRYLTSLSVQEPFVVYFKVSLLCGVVLASPWIAFQIWSFVAAGLYPHERAYVYKFLWPSVGLFLAGVALCQFVVLPGAVKALLGFNSWLDVDPDLRLNEWLGFALILPIVFGVSFQTPLVMFFLNRIGMFGWEDYWSKWRYAVIILAVFAAIITPTPDAVTMLYLFVPMFGLYLLGIAVCRFFPPSHEEAYAEEEEQVAV